MATTLLPRRVTLALALCAAFMATCASPRNPHVIRAADALDLVEQTTEEWGSVGVSDIVLTDAGSTFFALDHEMPTKDYIAAAKKNRQGAAARLIESFLDSRFKGRLQFDAVLQKQFERLLRAQEARQGRQQARRDATAAGGEGDEETETPVPDDSTTEGDDAAATADADAPAKTLRSIDTFENELGEFNELISDVAEPPFSSGEFAEFQAFVEDVIVGVSESDALRIGSSTKITERALEFLSNPQLIAGNRVAYLGVMQVSCSPGWRTRTGYGGMVTLTAEYARRATRSDARKFGLEFEKLAGMFVSSRNSELGYSPQPLIVSAFPLIQSQTLDLANSQRDQVEFMADLAVDLAEAGQSIAAQNVTKFVERLQSDQHTVDALPIVHSRSDGLSFTYGFRPRLQALGDPSDPNSDPEMVLQPIAFPAVVMVICDREFLDDWTHIKITMDQRWVPLQDRHWAKEIFLDWWYHGHAVSPSLSNRERLRNAEELDDALIAVGDLVRASPRGESLYTKHEIVRRIQSLEGAALGRSIYSRLPNRTPQVTAAHPGTLNQGKVAGKTLFVSGRRLAETDVKHPDVRVSVGPHLIDVLQVASSGALECQFPAAPFDLKPGKYAVEVTTAEGTSRLADAITVKAPAAVLKSADAIGRSFGNAPTRLVVYGEALIDSSKKVQIAQVFAGSRECAFAVLNKSTVLVVVPPWIDRDADADPTRPVPPVHSLTVVMAGGDMKSVSMASPVLFDHLYPKSPAPIADASVKITGNRVELWLGRLPRLNVQDILQEAVRALRNAPDQRVDIHIQKPAAPGK